MGYFDFHFSPDDFPSYFVFVAAQLNPISSLIQNIAQVQNLDLALLYLYTDRLLDSIFFPLLKILQIRL